MILFFDTETTGLPLWNEPSDDPRQPHIVQLAAMLCEPDGEPLQTYSVIVDPGVPIPAEVAAIHGIDDAKAKAEGVPPIDAVSTFINMASKASLICGHNVSFDLRLIRIAAARHLGKKWDCDKPTYCTMRQSTNVCRILHSAARHPQDWKWPKLSEAYFHFFGKTLDGAHDAMVDLLACRDVYRELLKLEQAA